MATRLPFALQISGACLALLVSGCSPSAFKSAAQDDPARPSTPCPHTQAGHKQLYWGDLHVHTAYSLDAYGFGTVRTPAEAFAFARGTPFEGGRLTAKIDRPLDFMAVTDHAEWLDMMHVCTEPGFSSHPYCVRLRQLSATASGSDVFKEYVNPTITEAEPGRADICKDEPAACEKAFASQWQRAQAQANIANVPCEFTAFIGFEWSATPGYSHTHRNVIFASDAVTDRPIDYIRYPKVGQLFDELDRRCVAAKGCEAISIPHNTNFGDGNSFDIETEDERRLAQRRRYEKLIEITQEKGTSECLEPYAQRLSPRDCDFETYIVSRSRPKPLAEFSQSDWERMRATYARGLLRRGLEARNANGNPLQLGFIGSTDVHTGAAGAVAEDQWQGTALGGGNFEASMSRLGFNPGGLAAVWAEENTRASIFAALKRREVYGTSGPRIGVRFHAQADGAALSCASGGALAPVSHGVPMGGSLSSAARKPQFRIAVSADKTPLQRIDIVRGVLKNGEYTETVVPIWSAKGDVRETCLLWTDESFTAGMTAYWYPRILEQPSPRWSAHVCRKNGRCADFPGAETEIQERAWASPIWYMPE